MLTTSFCTTSMCNCACVPALCTYIMYLYWIIISEPSLEYQCLGAYASSRLLCSPSILPMSLNTGRNRLIPIPCSQPICALHCSSVTKTQDIITQSRFKTHTRDIQLERMYTDFFFLLFIAPINYYNHNVHISTRISMYALRVQIYRCIISVLSVDVRCAFVKCTRHTLFSSTRLLFYGLPTHLLSVISYCTSYRVKCNSTITTISRKINYLPFNIFMVFYFN